MSESKSNVSKSPGRPTEVNGPTRKHYVTLDEATVKALKKIGEGNLSFGIREAARRLAKKS